MLDWVADNFSLCNNFHNIAIFKLLDTEGQENFVVSQIENDTCDNFVYFINPYLKLIKREKRHDFMKRTFKKKYNTDFSESPLAWESEIFKLLPVDDRYFYIDKYYDYTMKKMYSEGLAELFQPENILYLYKFDEAFPKLKNLLHKAATIEKRRSIILYMVKCCIINNEPSKLPDLVSYILGRHRNDDPKIITSFLDSIWEKFPVTVLSLKNIEEIEELVTMFVLKEGAIDHYSYASVMERIIHYRLENNLDVTSQIKNVIELSFIPRRNFYQLVYYYEWKHSRKIIELSCDELFKWAETLPREKSSEEILNILYPELLRCLDTYNKKHKNDKFSLRYRMELYEYYEKTLKKEHGDIVGDNLDHLWDVYGTTPTNSWFKERMLRYVLKRNPQIVIDNLESILNYMFTSLSRELLQVYKFSMKIFSFLNLTGKVKDMILNKIKSKDSIWHRRNAWKMYSLIATPEEFSETIKEYIPTEAKVDMQTNRDFVQIQHLLPRLIRNVRPRCKTLPLVFKFFSGDFIKEAKLSLYASTYSMKSQEVIPELMDFLENKSENRVSLQKIFVELIPEFSNPVDGMRFCVNTWNKITHHSIRQILLRHVFKFFLDNPTRETFDVCKKCVEEADETVLESRLDLFQIPKNFLGDYALCLWNFVRYRNSVISFFSDKNVISFLPYNFCEDVIITNLFQQELNVCSFTAHYILYTQKTSLLMELWEKSKTNLKNISELLTILMDVSWSYTPAEKTPVFEYILSKWPYSAVEILYEQRLLLRFYVTFATRTGGFLTEVKTLWEEIQLKSLFPIFGSCLKTFLSSVKSSDTSFDFWSDVLDVGFDDPEFCVIILLILSEEAVKCYNDKMSGLKARDRENILEVLNRLSRVEDEVVKIYFRKNFPPNI